MNYGVLQNHVLQLLNKYSTRGKELAPSKTADIRLKIESFINTELMDLATTTGKLRASKSYVVKPVYNELSRDTSSIKSHLPGQDFAIELTGAKSYFFEVQGPATVTIDENVNGLWANLETVEITETKPEFTEYKGLINPASDTNRVRLNFSGDYVYNYRYYILYPYSFPAVEDVQQHRPHFLFDLPDDYLDIENVMIRRDKMQWVPNINHILDIANHKIGLNRHQEGEVILNYYRKPVLIALTGVEEVDDLQDIDATPDGAYALALGVASLVTAKNDPATSAYLNNLYEVKKANMLDNESNYTQAIISVNGW
jgi:hypothetical protein